VETEERIMNETKARVIAKKDGVVLRRAQDGDLPTLDEIVVVCYTPIHDSYLQVVGKECARGLRRNPEVDWTVEKTNRVRKAYEGQPDCLWVLEKDGVIFGFVTFAVQRERNRAWIEENGVLPEHRGQGWATFMLRHVLQHLRREGIRFVSVEVDLDDVHRPARRAYQAVGFDRHHHIAIYHQDLEQDNPGSILKPGDKDTAEPMDSDDA